MKPSPFLRGVALLVVVVGFALLFGALLVDTWNATEELEPDGLTTTMTPLLSGALGLILAVSLGVEVKTTVDTATWSDRLKALFQADNLLKLGAGVYLISGVAGAVAWWKADELTPDLVTAVVLTVAGYAVATATALARN